MLKDSIDAAHNSRNQVRRPHRWCAPAILIAVLCGVALRGIAFAQADQIVYTDAIGSGWQNWSWAAVNLSNTQPVQAGSDSIAVNAGAYQALYLHQTAFDSTPYSNLVFWINGGSSGGQLVQVQATLNGTAQTVVTSGARGEYVETGDDFAGVARGAEQAEPGRILDPGSERDDAADILR